MSDANFYTSNRALITETEKQLTEYQTQLSRCYERWELLEQ